MASEPFGVGLVGAGFISRTSHAPSFEYVPNAEVAGILNPTRSKAADLAEDCRDRGAGDPAVYGEGEVADLVADPDVDGLWITSPNHTRLEVVEAAVEAVRDGAELRGVALEKPVARNLRETNRIRDLLEDAELPSAYLENWAYGGKLNQMRDLLWERGREAGRPYIARSHAEHGGPHSAWFWDGTKQGGGALTDMLCHALAGNDYLLRDPEGGDSLAPVAVSADVQTLKWNRPEYAAELRERYDVDWETDPADDYARVTVKYETDDGRLVVSEATGSWCYVGTGVSSRKELLGPEYSGKLVSNESSESVFFSDDLGEGEGWAEKQNATTGLMPVDGGVVDDSFLAENQDAVESFARGENARLDVEDGTRVMRLCMAAYKAAEEGEEIDPRTADLADYVPPMARE